MPGENEELRENLGKIIFWLPSRPIVEIASSSVFIIAYIISTVNGTIKMIHICHGDSG